MLQATVKLYNLSVVLKDNDLSIFNNKFIKIYFKYY